MAKLGDIIPHSNAPSLLSNVTRDIHTVFIHCSASDRPEHDSVHVMNRWHRQRGWSSVGYHFFIRKDGVAEYGRDWSRIPAAQAGHNQGTLAFCVHGLAKENFTTAQLEAVVNWCEILDSYFRNERGKIIRFRGHCEVSAKACPVFDYKSLLRLDAQGHLYANDNPLRAPESLPRPPTTLIQLFDRGEDVRKLQIALTTWGQYLSPDGIFGRNTRDVVIQFQKSYKLTADGIVGPQTLGVLKSEGYWPE